MVVHSTMYTHKFKRAVFQLIYYIIFLLGTSDVNAVDSKDLLGMYTFSISHRHSGAQLFNDWKINSSLLN